MAISRPQASASIGIGSSVAAVQLPNNLCLRLLDGIEMSLKYSIFSCSLNLQSRSAMMAEAAHQELTRLGVSPELYDLRKLPLPMCDAGQAYGDANARLIKQAVADSAGVLIASPIYNYDVNAAAKSIVELAGDAWTGKVVGFICAAGGPGSYMAVMGVANSLMLDFHCFILPHFVYATGAAFEGPTLHDEEVKRRLNELAQELVHVTGALNPK